MTTQIEIKRPHNMTDVRTLTRSTSDGLAEVLRELKAHTTGLAELATARVRPAGRARAAAQIEGALADAEAALATAADLVHNIYGAMDRAMDRAGAPSDLEW